MRRRRCEKRNHPKADMVVDERGFVVTFCPNCRTIKFQELVEGLFIKDRLVSYYDELLADYGFKDPE